VLAYVVRRLLFGVVIVWGVYTITFLAVNLAPGDPFTGKESAKITEADLNRLRARWGYDRPVLARYFLHARKMFWADPTVLDYEGSGLLFEVVGGEGGNLVRARLQSPPAEVVLVPTSESVLDDGAEEVRLARLPDGTYEAKPIKNGVYYFGYRKLSAYAADVLLDTAGVVVRYEGAARRVTAVVALAAEPPATLRLVPAESGPPPVELVRGPDGTWPTRPIPPGRWRHEDGTADLLVPDEPLGRGGLTFDLGTSIKHNQPVLSYLGDKFWNTIKLGFWSLLVNYVIGIALGVISAIRQNTKLDHSITVTAFFLYSMPGFWLALMLQLVFAVWLSWLPIGGMGDGSLWQAIRHYAMPVFVLGVAGAAGTARYQRSAMLEVLGEDYVRTARAKGLDEKAVVRKHVMANSLLPIITLFGLSLPFLVSGAVITEQVFSWPGIGRAAIDAIQGRDVFVVTAVTLAGTVMVVIGNLVSDVLYAVADPRVRLQ
jgi:peptide/nickel transport system permease protein